MHQARIGKSALSVYLFYNFNIFTMITIVAVTGSLDSESYTMKLVKAVRFHAPETIEFKILDISKLPYVAENFESALSSNLNEFYGEIETADAFIIATAEYKRSYSPALKNALDLGLAADGNSKWAGKPVSIFGCTPYSLNAFGGVGQLKRALEALHMEVFYKPDFYFCDAMNKFNEAGILTDQATRNVITGFWDVFVKWIDRRSVEKKLNQ